MSIFFLNVDRKIASCTRSIAMDLENRLDVYCSAVVRRLTARWVTTHDQLISQLQCHSIQTSNLHLECLLIKLFFPDIFPIFFFFCKYLLNFWKKFQWYIETYFLYKKINRYFLFFKLLYLLIVMWVTDIP